VNPPFLLPQEPIPARMPLRSHSSLPRLKLTDPATRAMTDFQREPPLTVSEDYSLEEAIDRMFRMGVRAVLVVRERNVVGLMTAGDAVRLTARASRGACIRTSSGIRSRRRRCAAA